VRSQGFDAQLEPRNDELPQYWLDIDVDREQDWRVLLGRQRDIGAREIPCQSPAAAG
jgi:hypothetical protein